MYLRQILDKIRTSRRATYDAQDHPIGALVANLIFSYAPSRVALPIDQPGITSAEILQKHSVTLDTGLWFSMLCSATRSAQSTSDSSKTDSAASMAAPGTKRQADPTSPELSTKRSKDINYETSEHDLMDDEPIDPTGTLAAEAAKLKSSGQGQSVPSTNTDDIEIVGEVGEIKKQSVNIHFASDGRYLFGLHSTTAVHKFGAIAHVSMDSDVALKRNVKRITVTACMDMLFEILAHVIGGCWACGWCPVAIAKRCHQMYFATRPTAESADFAFAWLSTWLVDRISTYPSVRGIDDAMKHMLLIDYPEVLNSSSFTMKDIGDRTCKFPLIHCTINLYVNCSFCCYLQCWWSEK